MLTRIAVAAALISVATVAGCMSPAEPFVLSFVEVGVGIEQSILDLAAQEQRGLLLEIALGPDDLPSRRGLVCHEENGQVARGGRGGVLGRHLAPPDTGLGGPAAVR